MKNLKSFLKMCLVADCMSKQHMPVLCQEYMLQGSGGSAHKQRTAGVWWVAGGAPSLCVPSSLSLRTCSLGRG